MRSGTPFTDRQVVTLDGKRYRLLTTDEAREVSGRRWAVDYVSAQDAEPEEFPIQVNTFHEGSGFTYAEMPGVYDYADGWDPMSPGKLGTWPRQATGAATTLSGVNWKGWIIDTGDGYMYVLKGNLASKFEILGPGVSTTWSKAVADFSLGAVNSAIVAGRPALFGGKWYVPIANSSGVTQRFYQLTPGGAGADTWTQGPVGVLARCFTTWRDLLVRADGNNVYTVAADPMTAADWAEPSAVATSDSPIIDLLPYDRFLMVRNTRGLWSFDEDLRAINELPDLEAIKSPATYRFGLTTVLPGVGMCTSNGYQIVPHDSGLVRWAPGGWEQVGPEQERLTEGRESEGWGPVAEVVPYGQWFFAAHNDPWHFSAWLVAYGPGRGGRGPLVPYCLHSGAEGLQNWFEAVAVVQDESRETRYLVALQCEESLSVITYRPYIFTLPRAGMTPVGDGSMETRTANGASFWTSRYYQPNRGVQKTYRTFEFWLDEEVEPGGTAPGFQIWASVDDGAFFQLLDATGAAATYTGTGFKRAFFPKTASAVGHYVQLKFVVLSTTTDNETRYIFRDGVLRCHLRPLTTPQVQAAFLLDGALERGQGDRRTIQQQKAELEALFAPNAAAVAYEGPNGESGYLVPQHIRTQEVVFKGGQTPVHVALVQLEVAQYA